MGNKTCSTLYTWRERKDRVIIIIIIIIIIITKNANFKIRRSWGRSRKRWEFAVRKDVNQLLRISNCKQIADRREDTRKKAWRDQGSISNVASY